MKRRSDRSPGARSLPPASAGPRHAGSAPPAIADALGSADRAQRALIMRELQRGVGNAGTQRLVAATPAPERASVPDIGLAERDAFARGRETARAPVMQPAEGGLRSIWTRASSTGAGVTGGLTVWGSPTPPAFEVRVESVATGRHTREHRATVVLNQEAQPGDHRAYFPGPGYHRVRSAITRRRFYARISDEMSELIRDGEQEHLDDGRRAFDLSYGRINGALRAMAERTRRRPFVSTRSPSEAQQAAEDALAARLPAALGAQTRDRLSPARWVQLHTQLLRMSRRRDIGPHWLSFDITRRRRRGLPIKDVARHGNTNIGIPSERIVRYPAP